jgi:DNA-binding HxlR family transcriptional regulator
MVMAVYPFVMGLLWETSYLEETTSITMKKQELDQNVCKAHHLAIRDTMELLSGKWKIRIIGALSFGPMRFMELKDSIEGIAAKMLSKELQDLELNGMVDRRVLNSKPSLFSTSNLNLPVMFLIHHCQPLMLFSTSVSVIVIF